MGTGIAQYRGSTGLVTQRNGRLSEGVVNAAIRHRQSHRCKIGVVADLTGQAANVVAVVGTDDPACGGTGAGDVAVGDRRAVARTDQSADAAIILVSAVISADSGNVVECREITGLGNDDIGCSTIRYNPCAAAKKATDHGLTVDSAVVHLDIVDRIVRAHKAGQRPDLDESCYIRIGQFQILNRLRCGRVERHSEQTYKGTVGQIDGKVADRMAATIERTGK